MVQGSALSSWSSSLAYSDASAPVRTLKAAKLFWQLHTRGFLRLFSSSCLSCAGERVSMLTAVRALGQPC